MKELAIMASQVFPFRCLAAIAATGLAFALAPSAPAFADEDPGYRAPRARTAPPRVRTVYRTRTQVRTVVQTRVVYVPQPVYQGCGGCVSAPIVRYAIPQYYVPTTCCASAPRFYADYPARPYFWAHTWRQRYHGYGVRHHRVGYHRYGVRYRQAWRHHRRGMR
jgi:hypothetical protein